MKKPILELIKERRVYFDGATGSLLQERGLPVGTPPEIWNIERPDEVISLHKEYLAAGADIIKTNTFGASPMKHENYEELIRRGVECAICAVEGQKDKYVALDVGPLGRLLSPLGDLDFEAAVAAFSAVAKIGAECGADLVLIETMNDAYETKAAVLGVREACDLPVFVTNVYDGGGKLMTGADPSAMVALLEGLSVAALGANCSLGPDKMAEVLPALAARSSTPIIVNPNAGLPEIKDGRTVYNVGAEEFARQMRRMAELGATVLGGCCGTTPRHIEETVKATRDLPYSLPTKKSVTAVSSYTHAVTFDKRPVLIGERINPTGKPKLKAALREGRLDYILTEAIGECDMGAEILDVNVGIPEIDEVKALTTAIQKIQAVCDAPLQLDTSDPSALASAMRVYNGKPLVNSVNGKPESMRAVFPLVKKYGGTVIALTIDEGGIPDTAHGRVEIAERIIREAEKYGIGKEDIIVDPLALSVSADKTAAQVTLDSIRALTERGIKTSLGVSNVSFGLPARDKINSAFFVSCMSEGLCAAIMNPYSTAMMDAYRAYLVIAGLDEGCSEYIGANSGEVAPRVEKTDAVSLEYAIRHGLRSAARAAALASLLEKEPLSVINTEVIPSLNAVGRDFESGISYLPELLSSAEAAGEAFEVIKERLPRGSSGRGRILLATVKGDIHDIGKNIVKVMLESYGFEVIDMGRDVSPEAVLDGAISAGVGLVGLSALMTTTVPAMKETVELIRKGAPGIPVMVGGAVLTPEYAEMISADFYGADAMEAVRIAEEVFGKN